MSKQYNVYGRDKWTYIVKNRVDKNHEIVLGSLSKSGDDPVLVKNLMEIGELISK